MNRRTFLKGVGMAGAVAAQPSLAAQDRPNIIFIMVDDMGIGDVGCYGQKKIKTPNIDRMAREGTRFTQCYASSAVCAPTRCTLMTGLHSGHCTRRGNRAKANPPGEGKDRGLVPLRKSDVTMAAMLKKAGYVTGGIGKWGLGNPGTTGTPDKHGFDFFYGYLDQVHAHDYYTNHLYRNTKREAIEGKVYAHDLFEKETEAFLREHRDKPFFLYLPYTLPHGKYVIPSDAPYSDEPWPQMVKNYAAMCTLADSTVGKIIGWLKELGIDEKTIVFFTSDNGPNPPFLKPFNSAAGLRGIKRQLYEGGIRMPMVVRWPGKVPAGKTSEFVWWFVDLMPTFAELAGAKPPKGVDGMSVVPTLLGRQQKPHDALYWEFHSPFHQAVRMGKWKGIRFGTEEPLELYDLERDPGEKKDVAKQNPAVVRRMAAYLKTARTESKYWPAVAKRKGRKGKKKGTKA